MAETIGALILSAAGASEITGIAGLGTLAGTTIAGVSLATIVGTTAIIGVSIGLNYALKPGLPKPEDGSQALKQALPPRIRGYGLNRLAGFYMLYEAAGPAPASSYDVIAFHSGRVSSVAGFYFNDDVVVPSVAIPFGGIATILGTYTDERYSHDAIHIDLKIGNPGQTASTLLTADPLINHVWTSNFVGNGIAYCAMVCNGSADTGLHTRVYPRGKPELSVVAECSPCWDPRDPAQARGDETTWLVSFNPVIQLIDYLTRVDGGMGLDYDTIIAPNLAAWMVEADLCDETVPTAVDAERRYVSSGWFQFDNKPEDVIGGILSTCDGHLAESGDGTLSITVGVYRAPTGAPITEKHIFGFALNYGQADEQMVNQLEISFTDPALKYVSVQTEPWRDEDAIALTGVVRSQAIDLKWVQSNSQARRLADRAMQRLNPLMTGSFTTSLYGLNYLGKRWVPVQYPFVSGLQDCVVEIQNAEVDLLAGRIVWDFIRIEPDTIEAYVPATDEGSTPVVPLPGVGAALMREDGTQYVREDGSIYARE
jgi:hypothetical protein